MNKRKISIFLAIGLMGIALCLTGVTFAYLMSNDNKSNVITVGENKMELKEEFTPPEQLIPGVEIVKKVWAENTGNTNSYVRARIMFSNSDMKNNCEALIIGSDWIYNNIDDYYYYDKEVLPGEKTSNLFEKVKVKSSATQTELKGFDITVYIESVTDNQATNYEDAWN